MSVKRQREKAPLDDANAVKVKDDKKVVEMEEICINTDTQSSSKIHSPELPNNQRNENCDSQEPINREENTYENRNIEKSNIKSTNSQMQIAIQSEDVLLHESCNRSTEDKNANINVTCNNDNSKVFQLSQLDQISDDQNDVSEMCKMLQSQSKKASDDKNDDSEMSQSQLDELNKNHENNDEIIQSRSNEAFSSRDIAISSKSSIGHKKERDVDGISKKKKRKKPDNTQVADICHKFSAHIERSVKEWITENTLRLLSGKANEKAQLLESFAQQHDRYQRLCNKVNRLELLDEKEDSINLEKNILKPLPHMSVLREEAQKMELKVRAFYEGQMTIPSPEDSNQESESTRDNVILPLGTYAPNALRRQIFLDKLSKILSNLLHTLTVNANVSSVAQCAYNNERNSLIKLLIYTFNLSAKNIVFKTVEWTLVGLVIIKMISLIDAQLQSLLKSKQVSMRISTILMAYKLDFNYLDRLITEVTNDECTK